MSDLVSEPRETVSPSRSSSGPEPRVDRIVPPGASAAGWVAFEDRILRRRGQARLEAARAALAAGRFEDARAALDEVRVLLGDTADEVVALSVALEAAGTVDAIAAVQRADTKRYYIRLSGAAALLLLGLIAARTSDWLRPRLESRPVPVDLSVLPPSPTVPPFATPWQVAAPGIEGLLGRQTPAPARPSRPVGTGGTSIPAPRPATPVKTPPPAQQRSQPVAMQLEAPDDATPASDKAAVPASVRAVDDVAAAVMHSTPSVLPAAAAPLNAPPIGVDSAESEIRTALQQYRRAYASLDAHAARAVWPSLDEQALARAFDGLTSQDLTFDRCNVAVRGARAVADCNGKASYVPKVGSREPRIEPRQWRFELSQSNGSWRIASVEAKR